MSEAEVSLEPVAKKSLVRIEGLDKEFRTGDGMLSVLKHLDFEIFEGERVAIVGQSGVGKSTLLHILGTIDHPSRGHVYFRDEDVFEMQHAELARLRNRFIGFVFQFHHLLPEFSAVENVMMPGLIQDLEFDEMRERASTMLEEVGLADRLEYRVGKLSGGERQRVAVARALVLDPPLILADEPTGNLDPKTGSQIADLLFDMNRTRGTTLVVVTHNTRMARQLGRIAVLRDGRLEEDVGDWVGE